MQETQKYGKQSELEPTTVSARPIDLSNTTKDDIKNYFINSYALYETIFDSLKTEQAYKYIPDNLRRPIIWYLGHTAALYINKLKDLKATAPVNEWFEKLFKTGVDPILPEELDNDVYQAKLPPSTEVWAFRQQVYKRVLELIDELPLNLPMRENDPLFAIVLSCEHERIHYETSSLLLRQMPIEMLEKPSIWKIAPYDTNNYPQNQMMEIGGQKIKIGKDKSFPTYGWDNEYGNITLDVRTFKASKFLISNGEYLEFVKSGGYNEEKNWSQDGWEWKERSNMKHPLFWIPDSEKGYKYRAIFDVIDMPLNWPVDVTHHEAKAYCNWKGENFRLIKEGEFNIIRGEQLLENYGKNIVEADIGGFDNKCGNVNVQFGSSSPVDYQRPSPLGFYDTYGNVWEWSDSYFKPLPGFKELELYYDFSGGCFDQKHNLLFGGAWSSTGLNASSFFRVAFRRHFYQNSGFRLVEDIPDTDQQEMYTDPVYLNRYLHFNFATNEEFFTQQSQTFDLSKYEIYPVKIADECIKYYEQVRKQISPNQEDLYENTHALDLGCGMGRTSFELARKFPRVTGLDYAHGFINVANELKEKGQVPYKFKKTGHIYTESVATIDSDIQRERIDFIQGDAMNLPVDFGPFDLIIASNLIDRLPNPLQCLIDLHPLLTYNGLLIITSPYTWMECITKRADWIGGQDNKTTFEALQEVMGTLCFELVDEQTMTLLIKEHERKFEFIMPHMTIWRKKQYSQEFATSIFRQVEKY